MSRQISEQGGDAALKKRIRQAVYDIRYKARKDELDLRHAYSQYIGKSGLDQTGKEAVQNKLFGKSQQAESSVIESAGANKYKVRFSNPEDKKTYIRYAKRDKINKLRAKGSVEMTGHGSPKGAKKSPSIKKKDRKGKLISVGPEPKKIPASKKKPGVVALPKEPVKVKVVEPKKQMKKEETDAVGSAVQALSKILKNEAFIADAAAVAPPVNKKITGEKVDNSKLIKVFPQDGSDPQIGSIKSSYKPVGEVVAEILNPPQQVDEVVGQAVGGLLGATAGKDLAAKGLTKVAGALTKAGAPKAIGKALTSKVAPKIAGAAAGAAAGEVLDPFKKNKDKNPVAAAAGGAAGGALHGAIKSSYKPVGEVVSEILANVDEKVATGPRLGEPRRKGATHPNAGEGEKIQKRTLKWMKEKGIPGSPGLQAMKDREAEHRARNKSGVSEAATPESGTGKYYDEKNPTPAQLKNRQDRAEVRRLTNAGKHKEASHLHAKINKKLREEVGVSTSAAMEKAKKEAKLQSKEQKAVNKALKKEEFADPFYKQVEYDDDDPRSMKTKWNLVKNRLRSLGLKCSNELEGDKIEEGKAGSAVTGTLGNIVGGTVGGAIGGPAGAAVGSVAGGALGASAAAKKGKKKSAAIGGALGSALGPVGSGVGAAIGASNELEGDTLEESEALAQKAEDRAKSLSAKRRAKHGYNTGYRGKERDNWNLSKSQRSRNASLETQGGNQTGGGAKPFGFASNKSNPVKSKRTGDTGAIGHYKNRDAKRTVSKTGKPLKKPVNKLSWDQKADHHSTRRQELKDPKKNPKHTANTQEGYQRDPEQQEKERKTSKQTDPSKAGFTGISDSIEEIMRQNAAMKKAAAKKTRKEHHQVDANGKVIEHGDGTPSSVEEGIIGKAVGKVAGGVVGGAENLAVGAAKTGAKVAGSVVKRTGRAAVGAVKGALSKEGYQCESNLVRDILTKKN